MLAKIGNFLGLTDAGHAPARQSGGKPDRDFGDFVAAERAAKAAEPAETAAGSASGNAEKVEGAETEGADAIHAATEPEPEADVESDAFIAIAEADIDPKHAVAPALVGRRDGSSTDQGPAAAHGLEGSHDAPAAEPVADDRLAHMAGIRQGTGPEAVGMPVLEQGRATASAAAEALLRAQTLVTDLGKPEQGAAATPESPAGALRGVAARTAGAAIAAPAQPGTTKAEQQVVGVSLPSGAPAAGTTSAEFASHRASLQAEKLAQLVSASGASPQSGATVPEGAAQTALPGAAEAIGRSGLSRKVETLIRAAEATADSSVTAAERGAATARAAAGAAAVAAPAASFVSAVASQAIAAAGIAHPSVQEGADDADAPEFATQGGSADLRAGSIQPSALAPPGRTDAAAIVRQITEAMPRAGNGTIEIRLSPDELGHVRLQMVPGENGMVVHIQADRPETLDLLRRHVDQLARDLAASGHGASGFTFAEGRDGQGRGGERSGGIVAGPEIAGPAANPPGREADEAAEATRVEGGLDMKI
ncbi:flagellar hook-length control protein FliK [Citreimonas salinaria]|uniref:Hook-length control protein FliK n=1 Tax=Citreimonas salinaria TaxID=321339 RepID=A0A1H3EXF1_9RHOB|nr:flagellar hook-length control protein FliK [Citreimonas salinaria]SDX82604.1 hook-length control protein FliK [Citreimonas salinaria]